MTEDPTTTSAENFVTSLPPVTDRTVRNGRLAALGMVLMIVGLIAAVVAVMLSQASDNPLDQSTQISLGIAGLTVACVGGAVFLRYSIGEFLRFWLLRFLNEVADTDSSR